MAHLSDFPKLAVSGGVTMTIITPTEVLFALEVWALVALLLLRLDMLCAVFLEVFGQVACIAASFPCTLVLTTSSLRCIVGRKGC
jgi:hypothetical protein